MGVWVSVRNGLEVSDAALEQEIEQISSALLSVHYLWLGFWHHLVPVFYHKGLTFDDSFILVLLKYCSS